MKSIISVSLIVIVFLLAVAASLSVLDIINYEDAIDFGTKVTASILILSLASVVIALLTKNKSK